MKKQFFRVKQLADQTFLRADRSECLNQDELKKADYKVEFIAKAFAEIGKKLPTSLAAPDVLEKRKKKYNEYALGATMQELVNGGNEEGHHERRDRMLLQNILRECGDAEMRLVDDLSSFECQVEEYVSKPINAVLDKELPNIVKQKKNLNKYILDKDSATNRYQNATKNGTPKDNLKEDMDEADIKVDQSRDVLAVEMFGLLRKENEMCMYLLQLLKMQRSYHESALKTLENVIPTLEQRIGESDMKPIFGCDLAEHLKISRRRIAFPLELCVLALTELGMSEEGLFRIVGGASRVKRLRLSIDSGCFSLPLIPEYRDVHVLASTLKSYLRELPEPLLTFALHDDWMDSMRHTDDRRFSSVADVLRRMPTANRENLGFLVQFLARLTKHPENKMTSSNIAIVMSPNLLWTDRDEMDVRMKNCATINTIVELLINNVEVFFPEDLVRHATIRKSELLYEYGESRTNNVVELQEHVEYAASPRLVHRRKVKPAPAPPPGARNDGEFEDGAANYNTLPLARTKKEGRARGAKVEEDERRSSLVLEDKGKTEVAESPALVSAVDSTKVQTVKSKPTVDITEVVRPVAAPRTIVPQEPEVRRDSMSKSLSSIDVDGETVQVRRPSKEDEVKSSKPAIPVRPASLRSAIARDVDVHRTQCSVYSTPHKQQPSIVNIRTSTFAAGHDNQYAEKERFLHNSRVENKFGDINSNCPKPEVPTKPAKSNERLDLVEAQSSERHNGNTKASHARTRSDGNIVDVQEGLASLLNAPPSPRSLSKPSQPPPPPPTNAVRSRAEPPETTNF